MQFIQRPYKPNYHVAERAIVPGLPEWRKMPYCRNGGLNLKQWTLVDIDPASLSEAAVCGACRRRLAAHGVDIGLAAEPQVQEAAR